MLTDNRIAGNSDLFGAGVAHFGAGDVKLLACVVEDNAAEFTGGGLLSGGGGGSVRVENCTFRRNSAWLGAGAIATDEIPVEANACVFEENTGGFAAGAVVVSAESFFENCAFVSNSALNAGAVLIETHSNVEFRYCTFLGNTAVSAGGVVYLENVEAPEVVRFSRCTFVANSGALGSIGYFPALSGDPTPPDGTLSIEESILWNNGEDLFEENAGAVTVTYSDIEAGYDGDGNIDEDPLFADAENGDLRLTKESPCIDAAEPDSPLDPDGTRADMGAFPFIQFGFFRGDVNGNGETMALLDAIAVLSWQFGTGEDPPCLDAADVDDDGTVTAILEALYLLQWQFTGGPAPPAPGPAACGLDGTDDTVNCATVINCP